VVEDDWSLVDVLVYNLRQAGYEVFLAQDGLNGLRQAREKKPDVIVLDVMLPGMDGLEVCRQLRANRATRNIRVLMLTAKSEETDQLVGFAVGADDYVTKPFSVKVLLERIKSLLRRPVGEDEEEDVIAHLGVTVDRNRYLATAGERNLGLTKTEFLLLEALIRKPGRAFTRAELMDAAIGEDSLVLERTIDVHVRALRQKLGDYADCIETVRGIGYRFRQSAQ
jgi:two-component system phosphate regulon response regulator PhoB